MYVLLQCNTFIINTYYHAKIIVFFGKDEALLGVGVVCPYGKLEPMNQICLATVQL